MKKALVIILVLLVAVTGIPVLMGMGSGTVMMTCDQCPGILSGGLCGLAVMTMAAALSFATLGFLLRVDSCRRSDLLLVLRLDRPPRFA